jgi:hypothetical protein
MPEHDKVTKRAFGLINRILQGIYDLEKLQLPAVAILMSSEDYKLFLAYRAIEDGSSFRPEYDTYQDIPILVVKDAKLKVLTRASEEYLRLEATHD